MKTLRTAVSALVVAATLGAGLALSAPASALPGVEKFVKVSQGLRPSGDKLVPVLVGLRTPDLPFAVDGGIAPAVQRAIASAQDALFDRLLGTHWLLHRRFVYIPSVALEVDAAAFDRLARDPLVTHVRPDHRWGAGLAETTHIIRSAELGDYMGFTGHGWAVAVIDTGVDTSHPFVANAVIHDAEGCFTGSNGCPNGKNSMTGNGAGAPCNLPSCPHGTHVAGIATGRIAQVDSTTRMSGVARGARLIPINVFHKLGNSTTQSEFGAADLIAAIEHVLSISSTYSIAAVNMSVGGGAYTSRAACDADNVDIKKEIQLLRARNIAPISIAGNGNAVGEMWGPGCVTGMISVGNTQNDDTVNSNSNSSDMVDLLAPGTSIRSSVPGGGYDDVNWSGTSMAGPHVAGAWAVLKEAFPSATIDQVLRALQSSGKLITDPKSNITRARIDVWGAYERLGIRVTDATVQEGSGQAARFTVTLPWALSQESVIELSTTDGSATTPSDYASKVVRLHFSPGSTSMSASIAITDDSTIESSERFGVRLRISSGPILRITRPNGVGTISDNDGKFGSRWEPSDGGTYASP